MIKLLVDIEPTNQKLLEVDSSGGFSEIEKILWDERVHGVFPVNLLASVGGLVRQGPNLVVDAAKLAAFQAAREAESTAASQRTTRVQQARQLLNGLDFSSPLSAAQLTQAVRALVIVLKDVASQL